ncbi:MAG TPA: pentapeptide repeat-containing protein [Myxococcota bacterium]|jgi:uncharacterized protein YjbI with pentapeptide repeats
MAEASEDYAEKLLDSVNEAAGAVSTRFVTFVSVGAYVAVTVASTTHEMLLRASNLVTLPLLNAQIPIIGPFGFYTIAPWLIVLLHSDLLLQLSILGNELARFDEEVDRLEEPQRTLLRQRVANFYYVLYLTGGAPSRILHLLSAFITWMTAVMFPLGLLLFIQIRFLPFHSPLDTWLHRAAVVVDAVLILFILLPRLWPRMREMAKASGWLAPLRQAVSVPVFIVLACVATVFAALFLATIPDRPGSASLFTKNIELRERVLTANVLTPEDINALRDATQPEQLREVLAKVMPFQALQGRDLRYADLYNAVLPRLDLRAVRTDEAKAAEPLPADCEERRGCEDPPECEQRGLQRTQLIGANFAWASMQGAMFDEAILDEADLSWAKLQNGSLGRAHLNRALLRSARLLGTRLEAAKLCGADLGEAEMQQAVLVRAHLQGASLRGARLASANLAGADLRGADLSGADLAGANLTGARLQGAVLRGANTQGANFDGANVELADLSALGAARPERAAIDAYLVGLACADPSVAHGIGGQALHSPARDGPALAKALLAARTRPDCAGVAKLAQTMLADLAVRAGKTGRD